MNNKLQAPPLPRMVRSQTENPRGFQKVGAKGENFKVAKGFVTHPLCESQWNGGFFSRMPAEGFKGHVATDGSVLGKAGTWRACGWAVVQLDYDEGLVPLHGIYGSVEVEFEVQRTIKRAKLTASLCLLKRVIGLMKVDNKGIIDGLRRRERQCIKAGDAEKWMKIWEELHHLAAREIVVEVEHVKAHRTKTEKKEM